MCKYIDKDPMYWVIAFDFMGWSISSLDTQFSFPLSEAQARYAIGAVQRASKLRNHFTATEPWGLALI